MRLREGREGSLPKLIKLFSVKIMDCDRKNPSLPGSGKTIEEGEYFVKNDVTDALFSLLKKQHRTEKTTATKIRTTTTVATK